MHGVPIQNNQYISCHTTTDQIIYHKVYHIYKTVMMLAMCVNMNPHISNICKWLKILHLGSFLFAQGVGGSDLPYVVPQPISQFLQYITTHIYIYKLRTQC